MDIDIADLRSCPVGKAAEHSDARDEERARQRALEAEADLAEKLHDAAVAVAQIRGTRDAGELLGLSHGRIHQGLVSNEPSNAKNKHTLSRGSRVSKRRAQA